MKTLATEEVAAETVGDGEGIAVLAVAGLELALEIGGPEIVGREDGGGGLSRMADASAPTADGNHAVSF
jgi:hypothetical protein